MSSLRERLKDGLKAAMKARQPEVVSILRSTLSEIDNAEAVETDTDYVPLAGRTKDVPRKVLTEVDVRQILQKELDEITAVITTYQQRGKNNEAAPLQKQASVLSQYLQNNV